MSTLANRHRHHDGGIPAPRGEGRAVARARLSVALLALTAGLGVAAEAPPLIEPATLAAWGAEALAQIQKDLSQPGSALYAEYGTPDGQRGADFGKYAFVWPASYQLRALASACRAQPDAYTKPLNALAEALDEYWVIKDGLGGYAVLPRGAERYYDDNASMALALLDGYEACRRPDYLERATRALAFAASGEKKTPGGGIRQHEDKEGPAAVCATAPATLAALRLHRLTQDPGYLRMAERWYAWLLSENAGIRDPANGLFHEQKEGPRAYTSAWVLHAGVLLYEQTKDRTSLDESQKIARSALANWIQPDGSLKETGQWGGSDLCDALLALYAADRDSRWLAAVHGMLRFVHDSGRDKNGHYGEYWHEARGDQALPKFHLLYMAPVARAYWAASVRQQDMKGNR